MESVLGFRDGGVLGFRDGGSSGTTLSTAEAMRIPSEAELELGLGLSLGRGGVGGAKEKSSAWGERGRILTAKDFPAVVPHVPTSSSTFSSKPTFTSPAVCGTKRAADYDGGSPTSAIRVVGWPPIRSYRINRLNNLAKNPTSEEDKGLIEKDRSSLDSLHGKNPYSTGIEKRLFGFVKVNMDGVAIGRKVDLTSHSCYETLALLLEDMFLSPNGSSGEDESGVKKSSKLLDGSSEFVLTYEDREGDWMLVGDVPWGMFLSSVRKLRIMRTSEANGLAPRCQERIEKRRTKQV